MREEVREEALGEGGIKLEGDVTEFEFKMSEEKEFGTEICDPAEVGGSDSVEWHGTRSIGAAKTSPIGGYWSANGKGVGHEKAKEDASQS